MLAEGLEVLVLGVHQVDHLVDLLLPGQVRTHLEFLLLLEFLADVSVLVLEFPELLVEQGHLVLLGLLLPPVVESLVESLPVGV